MNGFGDVPFIKPINSMMSFFFVNVFPIIKLKSFLVKTAETETKSFIFNPFALIFFNCPVGNLIEVLNNFVPGACAILPIPT